MRIFGITITTKTIAAAVAPFLLTEGQKAVGALARTDIGKAVAADIASLTDARMTGAQKFELVVANTLPLIASLLTKSGRDTAIAEVEDVGRALVQQVYNDTMSTKAGSIATAILKLLGIK